MSRDDGYLTVIRPRVGMKQHASDFANTFKAFIGSGYLAIPFAFTKSGIGLGMIGMLIAAFMTDHCCQLIIRAKTRVTNNLLIDYEEELREPVSIEHIEDIRGKMEKNITYGSIGKLAFGRWGLMMVNIPLLITQFGFCTAYFIFIANTVDACFPVFKYTNLTDILNDSLPVNYSDYNEFTYDSSTNMPNNMTVYTEETAPSMYILALIPLPIFIGFAMMRGVRKMGPASMFANISIFIGYLCILIYVIVGIVDNGLPKFDWFVFASFPVFWGQITGSYEGIGTIVAIESSMDGNRHLFPCFLHVVLVAISTMLCGFGVAGYLRYGADVSQSINTDLPPFSAFSLFVNVTLLIGVVCTFPLQNFPVIRIMEGYVFGEGSLCRSSKDQEDRKPLIRSPTHSKIMDASSSVDIPDSVSTWKRNIFRAFLVLLQFGLALLLKDFYAYFLSLVGALGSSPLAYILPCIFHLKLRKGQLKPVIIAKDILIIIIGTVGMLFGCYSVISDIVKAFDK